MKEKVQFLRNVGEKNVLGLEDRKRLRGNRRGKKGVSESTRLADLSWGEIDEQPPNQLAAQLEKFCLTELNEHQSSENCTTQRFSQMSKSYELVDSRLGVNIFMIPQFREKSYLLN